VTHEVQMDEKGYHRLVMEELVLQPSVNGTFPKKYEATD